VTRESWKRRVPHNNQMQRTAPARMERRR
jgi:hypothetical protein